MILLPLFLKLSLSSISYFQAYKVIVCTCVSSAVLWGVGVPKGHFTHIFVDEAAQATEPGMDVTIVIVFRFLDLLVLLVLLVLLLLVLLLLVLLVLLLLLLLLIRVFR
jgi:hypothetical protein